MRMIKWGGTCPVREIGAVSQLFILSSHPRGKILKYEVARFANEKSRQAGGQKSPQQAEEEEVGSNPQHVLLCKVME